MPLVLPNVAVTVTIAPQPGWLERTANPFGAMQVSAGFLSDARSERQSGAPFGQTADVDFHIPGGGP